MWISSLYTKLWFFARNLNELNPKFTQFVFDTLAKMLNFALVLPCKCAIIASKMLNAFYSPSQANRLNAFSLGVAIHKFNANLPLDCYEFACSRFVNCRNDEFLVILGVAKYP